MDFEGLNHELKAKVLACETADELVALAKSAGVELTDEQLEAVSGGRAWYDCPGLCEENRDVTGGHL